MYPRDPILSRPYPVYWAGWETTTARLQQAGWSLSVEQDISRDEMRLALRHDGCRLYALSARVPYLHFLGDAALDLRARHPFVIQMVSSDITVRIMDDLSAFAPIDAKPQYTESVEKSIEDFSIFAAPLVRTQELIVDPNDVQALLDRIKAVQAPQQASIRQRNRTRAYEHGAVDRQVFHAQIISLAERAAA